MDNLLAVSYVSIGNFHEAETLLGSCLEQAKSIRHETYVGIVLHNYGCLHRELKNWDTAINYFDQAFAFFPEGSDKYLENLYYKIYCLIMGVKTAKAKRLQSLEEQINRAKALSDNNEKYSILFESLYHRLHINNEQSCTYIETVTIPYLLETSDNFRALEFCELLKQQYKKSRKTAKTLAISEIQNKIYAKIVQGEVKLE